MSVRPFLVEPLGGGHDRTGFSCGVEALDRYLRRQASQDVRRRIATCFVLMDAATRALAGYYTLSAAQVRLTDLPRELAGKLPRYDALPAVLLGRLAVSAGFRGQKLGAALLADAIGRAARAEIGAFAVLADPKTSSAQAFYARHGFLELPAPEARMLLPINEALRALAARPLPAPPPIG